MWFFSKYNKRKKGEKQHTPFLRKALPEKRRQRIEKKNQPTKITNGVLLLWFVFAGTLFYLFFFSSFVLVEHPLVLGTETLSQQDVEQFVEERIMGKYWGIFPKRAYPVIPMATIVRDVYESFPLVSEASLIRSFPNTLTLSLHEKKKILLWATPETTYMIDEQGALKINAVATTEAYQKFALTISDMSHTAVNEGSRVMDTDFMAFLLDLDQKFSQQLNIDLLPQYSVVSQFSDELRVRTTDGWEVYFSTSFPLEKSLRTLRLLFDKELSASKREKLEYIDMRVENRIYYTFRDSLPEEYVTEKEQSTVKQTEKDKKEKKKK